MGAIGPGRMWGTWEELILGGAVLRHGTCDWNVVASELRARTLFPYPFTPQACKTKYEDLQKRYSGSTAWFEELRKRRVAELKQALARSEDSIGSLESKIKSLEAGKQHYNQADGSSQTESPLRPSDGTESLGKDTPKHEHSAGSFTEDTGPRKSWSQHHHPGMEAEMKPTVSNEQDRKLNVKDLPEAGYGNAVTIRKRRGQRKRKNCNQAVVEGSVGESDNLGSSDVASILKDRLTNECGLAVIDSGAINCKESTCTVRKDNVIEIFESIAKTEPAGVFRHRMDSQKRARYRKVIRQHLDIGTIRSRIAGRSIKSAKELFRDLLLLANNALVFYSRRTREYKSAFSLRHLVMKEYKQYCRGSYHEATSAFIPCNPPVKPRSARPRPRPRSSPCEGKVQDLSNDENSIHKPEVLTKQPALEKPSDSPTAKQPSHPPTSKKPSDPPASKKPSDPPASTKPSDLPPLKKPSDPPTSKKASHPPPSRKQSDPPILKKPSDPLATKKPSDPTASKKLSYPPELKKPSDPTASKKPSYPPELKKPSDPTSSTKPSDPLTLKKLSDIPSTKKPSDFPASKKLSDPPAPKKPSDCLPTKKRSDSPATKKLSDPPASKKRSDSDNTVSPNSLKAKKGLKRQKKVKPEAGDKRPKTSPLKQRKRVRK